MTFGQSQLNFLANNPQCVAQVVKTSLQLWEGEWSFDTSVGFPLLQGVLGKQSQSTADLTIQNYVLGIQGVENITEYESIQNRTTRNFFSRLVLISQFSGEKVTVISPMGANADFVTEGGQSLITEGGSEIVIE